jgi:DNA-binding NarL/FixJ family response regulator
MPPLRVLMVDDYEPFLQVLRAILPSDRFHVIAQASDGLEAVKKAELLQPDLILLDVGLPRLNGIEVARRVKELFCRTAILMLSQDTSPEVVGEALKAGALGYIHKPRAQRELLIGIECVLAGKRFVSDGLLDFDSTDGPTSRASRRHRVLHYSDESELLDGLAAFITDALRVESPVISVVTKAHRDSLIRRVKEAVVDFEGAMSRGRWVWFDADERVGEAQIKAAVQRVAQPATKISSSRSIRVAICGELAGRLCAEGKINEALALELFADRLACRFDLDLLCAYPASHSQSLDAQRASVIHSIVHAT